MNAKNPNMTIMVDASLYVFRSYHAGTPNWKDQDGHSTHAVHGFTQMLINLLEQTGVRRMAVCFDEAHGSCFRNRIYPAYKANREPASDDLVRQFAHCKNVVKTLGIVGLASPEFEADDLIGALAAKLDAANMPGIMISADKDLAQLHSANVGQWDFTKGVPFGVSAVREKYGVEPHQMADLQALSGDATDNIPGISGIGPLSAASLLRHFGDLESVLTRAEELKFIRSIRGASALADKIKGREHLARLSKQLTTIARDCNVPALDELHIKACNLAQVNQLFDELGFGDYLRNRVKRWLES